MQVRSKAPLAKMGAAVLVGMIAVTALVAGSFETAMAGDSTPPPRLTVTGGGLPPLSVGPVFPTADTPRPPTRTSTALRARRYAITIAAWDPRSWISKVEFVRSYSTTCVRGDLGHTANADGVLGPLVRLPVQKQRAVVTQLTQTFSCSPGERWTGADVDIQFVATNGAGEKTTTPFVHLRMRP